MDRRVVLVGVLAAVAVVAAFLLGLALGRTDSDAEEAVPTVSVSGSGTVEVVPDEAVATFGVSVTAPNAADARSRADRRQQQVIAVLKAKGVDDADIQTSDISLSPNYGPSGRRVSGYTASNSVTVTIRNLDEAGTIVPAVVAVGANQIGGLSLVSSEQDALYKRALEAAVEDARGRAEAIATASGAALGPIRSVSESSAGTPIPYEAKAAETATRTPIEPGTLEVTAEVAVTFELE
jgi:hypothetical protein